MAPTKRTTKITDGAVDVERMRELGRRGRAAVDVGPDGKFRRRAPAAPDPAAGPSPADPTPPPAPDPTLADPPADPPIERAPGLLSRFLGRGR